MECAISDAEEGFSLGVVGVFAIALEEGKGRQKVTLLQEVAGVWQSQLLLLLGDRLGQMKEGKGYLQHGPGPLELPCCA